jgi:hypothetical protein
MKEELLDLDGLSTKLNIISAELEKTEDPRQIVILASAILKLMEHRVEYYYQFFHGGIATGFNYDSADLMNRCQKLMALAKFDQLDAMLETKVITTNAIKGIEREIDLDSKWRQPSVISSSLHKPPEWMQASSFFVSYSHKDKIAEAILPIMQLKIGCSVDLWIDKYDLKRHQQLPKEISDALKKSYASVLILSKNFFESKWCNEEWQSIFMKRLLEPQYRLYQIRIDDEEYPPLLNTFYYTDCRGFPRPEALVELNKLLREVEDFETINRFRARTIGQSFESS